MDETRIGTFVANAVATSTGTGGSPDAALAASGGLLGQPDNNIIVAKETDAMEISFEWFM